MPSESNQENKTEGTKVPLNNKKQGHYRRT